MFELFEFLKREKNAFELFKEAYRAHFPAGATGPPQGPELNIPAPQLAADADAGVARAALQFVPFDATFFAEVEEGRFAEIEWL
jgi:hypothetical protein